MVQVDVFWSYALGAGFAIAAGRQLATRKIGGGSESSGERSSSNNKSAGRSEPGSLWKDMLSNEYFTKTLLFLGLIFGPSGAYLLWGYTSWETMHAGDKNMSVFLATAFAFTNISQGILAFFICNVLIKRSRPYYAYLQLILGYFGMFFILVHGWDGMGYMRFFSPTLADFSTDWSWATALKWLVSPVALSLYGMGCILLPVLFAMVSNWVLAGHDIDASEYGLEKAVGTPTRVGIILWVLAAVFPGTLGSAIFSSVLIHLLGWYAGVPLALALIYFLGVRRGGFFHYFYKKTLSTRDMRVVNREQGTGRTVTV